MAKKILLADDSLTIQKVVELTFSDSEYDLICVSHGQRALDRIAAGEVPDLILADVVMPEKNGYEVCEAIKTNPATARIPVVLLSGTFEPFDRERAERLGCDAIVSKPFDSQQLLRQVEALLARPPEDVASAATTAIPLMSFPAAAPSSAIPEPAPMEGGFSPEDFPEATRTEEIAGGPDLFEEEYGQADVESAIAAFEKAQPEAPFVDDDETAPGTRPARAFEAGAAGAGVPDAPLAEWLPEQSESPFPPESPAAPPAPFWMQREPESHSNPLGTDEPVSGPDSESAPRVRADEAPTQQIRLAADFASLPSPPVADRSMDVASGSRPVEDQTAEIVISEVRAPADASAGAREAPSGGGSTPVSSEIEVLAQTTSIGQLKEMLSSVSRGAGNLTDEEVDRLASRVVERLSERVVREIAWEVIPDLAELVIKQRIRELESGVD